jgi:hypothetical protein
MQFCAECQLGVFLRVKSYCYSMTVIERRLIRARGRRQTADETLHEEVRRFTLQARYVITDVPLRAMYRTTHNRFYFLDAQRHRAVPIHSGTTVA